MNTELSDRTCEWLTRRLARGPVPQWTMIREGKERGFDDGDLAHALRAIGGRRVGHMWQLTDERTRSLAASATAPAPVSPTWSDVYEATRRERERCAAIAGNVHAIGRSKMVASLIESGTPAEKAMHLLTVSPPDAVWVQAQARGTRKAANLDATEIYRRRQAEAEHQRRRQAEQHAGTAPSTSTSTRADDRESRGDVYRRREHEAEAARRAG